MDTTPEAETPDDDRGIRCPDCGCGHFFTLETRKKPGGRVWRCRKCRHCGRKISTYERAFG